MEEEEERAGEIIENAEFIISCTGIANCHQSEESLVRRECSWTILLKTTQPQSVASFSGRDDDVEC